MKSNKVLVTLVGALVAIGAWQGTGLARPAPQSTAGGSPHGKLANECSDCHSEQGWKPLLAVPKFDHGSTGYKLEAAHAQVGCRSCHRNLEFSRVGSACADCHADPHRGELGAGCDACHRPTTWNNTSEIFRVHARGRFPLLAVHAALDCRACHAGQPPAEFVNTPTECGECHARDYAAAKNPDHVRSGFSRRCEDCHSVVAFSWRGARFDDHARTGFALTGGHTDVACEACHRGGRYAGTSSRCFTCHEADYRAVTNPNHVASGFSTTCENCHTSAAWRPASFTDHSTTRFPLTGAHQGVDCTKCHVNGRFAGTPVDCYACHEADYRRVQSPNHVSGNFSRECQVCHSTSTWSGAGIDHDRTAFPLTGAHRSVDCARCHTSGRYAGTPKDCYSCHQADYAATRNPNHASAGFPRQCEECHSTTRWQGATFDHDGRYFPIYSGEHRGEWNACTDCHNNAGNYAAFECINCHAHRKTEMDDEHRRVSGYVYQSSACYRCHPQGKS